VHNQKRNTNQ